MVFGVHMCRGNFKGHYLAAGGYESVAERFFTQTKVNHFLLEYDTERAGDFKPLRFVKGKGVVLGLISSKTPVLESLDDLKRRTEEATQYHRPRPAGDLAAMRLCFHRRRQSGDRSRSAQEAGTRSAGGAGDLGRRLRPPRKAVRQAAFCAAAAFASLKSYFTS